MTKRLRVPVRPRRLLPTEVMTNARRARTTLSERPMPTHCAPCPGKTNATRGSAERGFDMGTLVRVGMGVSP